MTIKETKNLILDDLRALCSPSFSNFCRYLLCNAGFKVIFWFRLLNWIKTKIYLKPLYVFLYFYYKHLSYLTGIQIPLKTKIGGGVRFAHFSCIVINENVSIGKNIVIFQGVTIGGMRGKGCPNIGDNCVIASGAKIIGKVKIGNNCFIGANAVVTKDVEDGMVVAGIPAKVVSNKGREYTQMYICNN